MNVQAVGTNAFAVPSSMPWGDEMPGFIQLVYISMLFADVSVAGPMGKCPLGHCRLLVSAGLAVERLHTIAPHFAQQAVG